MPLWSCNSADHLWKHWRRMTKDSHPFVDANSLIVKYLKSIVDSFPIPRFNVGIEWPGSRQYCTIGMGTIRSTLELIFPPLIRGPPSNTTAVWILKRLVFYGRWRIRLPSILLLRRRIGSRITTLILLTCIGCSNIPPLGSPWVLL